MLQLLGGRFWDVRDCLPVQRSDSSPHPSQAHTLDAQSTHLGPVGVGGAEFVEACAALALGGQRGARELLLLEQALQVPQERTKARTSMH
jgi:hypothetical protein